MKPPQPDTRARVLLVDDKPENLRLLAEILSTNYRVQVAISGEQAIRAVREHRPDIVLLDISMPEMDGFEVCRRLKADTETQEVPVIFVTALAKAEEKVFGLKLGGVDYITKPFQIEEVVARLETHLEIKRLRDALSGKVADLEDSNGRLELFSKALAHDLRSPLSAVLTTSQLLLMNREADENLWSDIELIHEGALAMNDIIKSLLLLATVENTQAHCEEIDMNQSFESAAKDLATMVEAYGGVLNRSALPTAYGNTEWVARVWSNFLSNALKYGGKPPVIDIGGEDLGNGDAKFWVDDNGSGLSAEQKDKLFTAFNRLEPKIAEGIGLGLVIVKKIVAQMGGQTGIEDAPAGGSRFFFTLPREATAPQTS